MGRWLTVVGSPPQPRTFAWKDRRLLVMLAVGTVFAVVYLLVGIALPLTVVARGLPAGDVGLLLTVAAATVALGQPLLAAGPVARLDDFAAMAVGYLLLAAGLVAVGLVHDLVPLAAATVLWSLGDLVLLGRATAVVAGLAPAGTRGGYLATYGLGWGVAAVVGPLRRARLFAAGGPVLLWSVLGVVVPGSGGRPARRTPGGQRAYSTRQRGPSSSSACTTVRASPGQRVHGRAGERERRPRRGR